MNYSVVSSRTELFYCFLFFFYCLVIYIFLFLYSDRTTVGSWVRFPQDEMKYYYFILMKYYLYYYFHFHVLAKPGVEFCHSKCNCPRIRQKVGNGSYLIGMECVNTKFQVSFGYSAIICRIQREAKKKIFSSHCVIA